MEKKYIQYAYQWMNGETISNQVVAEVYCETRDVFQARLEKMTSEFLRLGITEEKAYLISAISGEIGNNSFDHNGGNWPSVPGVWFSYEVDDAREISVVLADRGRGVLRTLQPSDTSIQNDEDALLVAFTKKVTGRAPENRGNGLKFVRRSVTELGILLDFFSGWAKLSLNGGMKIEKTENETKGCVAILKG